MEGGGGQDGGGAIDGGAPLGQAITVLRFTPHTQQHC